MVEIGTIAVTETEPSDVAIIDSRETQVELAQALFSKGRKCWSRGEKDEALSLFRKAAAINESTLGPKHKQTAESYYFLGYTLYKNSKDFDKALIAFRRTLRSRLWTNGCEDIATEDVQRVIHDLLINKKAMKDEDVQEYFAKAAESVQHEKNAKDSMVKGDYTKAVEAYEKCLSVEKNSLGYFPLDVGRLYMKIGDAQRKNKEYEMSLNAYRSALYVFQSALGMDHADSKHCIQGIQSCALSKDIKDDVVREYLQKISVSLDHCRKGDELLKENEFRKAVDELESARVIEEEALGKYPLTVVGIRKRLATAFESMREYERAIFELRATLSINIFDCGGDHPSVVASIRDIREIMKANGLSQDSINRYVNTVSFSVKHQRYGEHLLSVELDYSTAIEEFQKSLALEVSALGKYHLTQGSLFKNIGDAFFAKRNFDLAVVNYRNALLVYLPVLGKPHIDSSLTLSMIGRAAAESIGLEREEINTYRESVAESILLEKSAELLASKGAIEDAIQMLENAVALEESSLVEYHLSTAELHNKIATMLNDAGQHDRAIVKYRNILSIYLRALGADHPNTQSAHDRLVKVISLQGLGKERANAYGLKVLVSIEHEARGDEDLALNRYAQAMGEFRKGLEIEENSLGEAHLITAALYGKLGEGYRLAGRSAEAILEYRKAVRIYVTHESNQNDAEKVIRGLGKCIQDLGLNEKKGEQYRTVVWESVKSEKQGDCSARSGQYSEALRHYQRSISLEESVLGKLHSSTFMTYKKIADICRDTRDYESAIVFYSKVLAIGESNQGKEHEETVAAYNDLMNVTQKQSGAVKMYVDGWTMLHFVLACLVGLIVLIGSTAQILSNRQKFTKRLSIAAYGDDRRDQNEDDSEQIMRPKYDELANNSWLKRAPKHDVFSNQDPVERIITSPFSSDKPSDIRVNTSMPSNTQTVSTHCDPKDFEKSICQDHAPKATNVSCESMTTSPSSSDKPSDIKINTCIPSNIQTLSIRHDPKDFERIICQDHAQDAGNVSCESITASPSSSDKSSDIQVNTSMPSNTQTASIPRVPKYFETNLSQDHAEDAGNVIYESITTSFPSSYKVSDTKINTNSPSNHQTVPIRRDPTDFEKMVCKDHAHVADQSKIAKRGDDAAKAAEPAFIAETTTATPYKLPISAFATVLNDAKTLKRETKDEAASRPLSFAERKKEFQR